MLVVLGATGDLCKKKIFPSIDKMLRAVLYKCTKTKYIQSEIETAPGTLSSGSSKDALQDSPLTQANPADMRKRVSYHTAEPGKVNVTEIGQGDIIRNSKIEVPEIIGYGRSELSTAEFIRKIDPSINFMKETVKSISYIHGPYEECLERVERYMEEKRGGIGDETVFLYMAVPQEVYPAIIEQVRRKRDRRLVILAEKPHGTSQESFREIEKQVEGMESRLLCVDHYLFKNVVLQMPKILSGSVVGELLVPECVEGVKAYFKEVIGAEGQIGHFNKAGICRDVLQNHLLQFVAIILSRSSSKIDVLSKIAPLDAKKTKFGVYRGYREVLKKERVEQGPLETYVKTRSKIGGEWDGTPLKIECGKKMKTHFVGVRVKLNAKGVERVFRYRAGRADFENPKKMAQCKGPGDQELEAYVRVEITPKEEVTVDLMRKKALLKRVKVPLERSPDGASPYQLLFTQLLLKKEYSENFALPEEIREQWRIVEPILDHTDIEVIDY